MTGYFRALISAKYAASAIKTSLFVGTVLFLINHGSALVSEKMDSERWFSAVLTYFVPYAVQIYGQYCAEERKSRPSSRRN